MEHAASRPPQIASQGPELQRTIALLGDRWTFMILLEAFAGTRRYGEFQRNLGIARNVLAERLRRLVDARILARVKYRSDPDWYEYRLTPSGERLGPVAAALVGWGEAHFAEPPPER